MNFQGKVLVADDEPHLRKFVAKLMGQLGSPTVLEAANGEEAVAIFKRERPRLVLLDVNMPVLDGLEALKAMIEADPDALVVMLTSLANRQTVEDTVRLGAAGYIRKDMPREQIIEQLKEILTDEFGDSAGASA